jgi:hypothetical protein
VTRVGETAMLDAFARFAELRPDWADWRIQIEVRMASLEVPLVGPPGGGKPGRYVAHIGLMGPGTPRWNQDRQEYERSAGPEVCDHGDVRRGGGVRAGEGGRAGLAGQRAALGLGARARALASAVSVCSPRRGVRRVGADRGVGASPL